MHFSTDAARASYIVVLAPQLVWPALLAVAPSQRAVSPRRVNARSPSLTPPSPSASALTQAGAVIEFPRRAKKLARRP